MNRRNANMPLARNRGFVLMAAVLLLGLVSMAVLLSSLSSSEAAVQQSLRTQLALKEAKEAVLGYILLDASGGGTLKPGSIPCPDRNNDNQSNPLDYAFGNCVGSVYTFRYPGKEFRTGELRDSANEKLWYAISPEFRVGSTDALNSSVPGTLKINGNGEYVAIVLAPGIALPGQRRSDPANPAHFLEGANAEGTSNFVTPSDDDVALNDRLIGISFKEWEDALLPRVFSEIVTKLNAFKKENGYFPWTAELNGAAPSRNISSTPALTRGLLPVSELWPEPASPITPDKRSRDWFGQNKWYEFIYYVVAPAFTRDGAQNCDVLADCLTIRQAGVTTTGVKALMVFVGRPISASGQIRPSSDISNYLEGEENTNGDNVFELPSAGAISNDRFYIIK